MMGGINSWKRYVGEAEIIPRSLSGVVPSPEGKSPAGKIVLLEAIDGCRGEAQSEFWDSFPFWVCVRTANLYLNKAFIKPRKEEMRKINKGTIFFFFGFYYVLLRLVFAYFDCEFLATRLFVMSRLDLKTPIRPCSIWPLSVALGQLFKINDQYINYLC